MRSSVGGSRNDSGSDGVTPSEQIRLVPPSTTKPSDNSVSTNATPQQQPSFVQQFHANQDTTALDNLFTPPARRPAAPATTGNNAPNPQALAGGGSGIGGASTPNAGGGGSSGGGGGAGPGVTNASQWLSAYFNMVGSALTPAGSSATSTTTAATPTASGTTHPLLTATTTATPQLAAPTAETFTPQASYRHPKPPPPPHKQPQGADPLYVLDMNTGETVPANTPLNSFSSWGENLLAQVSGSSVMSYTWDTSQAPDLTNITGQTGPNLQGTWASFTGAARTDTITLSEMTQDYQTLTQTMTYLVAGTDSPGYSTARPTSGTTWPAVVTPDQLTGQQATQPGGPDATLGLADGSVQTAFAMPSYNPNVAPLGLIYNSTAANAQPIFLARYQLPTGQAVPSTITAQLTFDGTTGPQVVYNTANLNPGDWVQMALQGDATGLSTGRYAWQVAITNVSTTNYSGSVDIVNQASSVFGAGWSLDGVDQLVPVAGSGVILVQPGGTSLWFANGQQSGTFVSPAGDFSTLVQNQDGSYTRTLTDGTKVNFDSTGRQTSVVDRDGNTTTYTYTSGLLTGITDMNNQTTTLAYAGGLLTSITDPASRTATLAYTSGQLTSITDPASEVWQDGYDSSNRLTTLTDPDTNATTFTYNFAGRVSSVTQADTTTERLTAEQMNGLASPGTGTPGNPATTVLLATGDQAQWTDANNQVWATGLGWLGLGQDVSDADPLGDTSLIYRDSNGLAWMSADGLGRRTRDFFDTSGNVTEAVAADDTTQQYQYNSFAEVTKYTDQESNVTSYTYNTKGDQTQVTDALNETTTYAYNSAGLVTSVTDPLNHTTSYGYDTLNRLTSVTNALNGLVTYSYDSASNQTGSTDARGFASTFAYDAMGRVTSQTLPDTTGVSSTTTFAYDKAGNLTATTDPLNHQTTYGYDKLGRQTSVTDALGHATTYGYDHAGNLTSVLDAAGDQTTYGYDAAGNQTSMTDPMGDLWQYGYDAAGEQTDVTDPLSDQTLTTYSPRGKVASVQRLDVTGLLVFEIDYIDEKCGCVKSITVVTSWDADGDNDPTDPDEVQEGDVTRTTVATYQRDALHRVTAVTDALGLTTKYSYDAAGNLSSVADPLNHATTYGYNAMNALTITTDVLGNATKYGYDNNGNLTSVTDPLGKDPTYTYDAQGRVLTATDNNGGVTTYTYDLAGNLASITDPDNNTTRYTYDAANRLTAMTDPLGHSTTYAYDSANRLTSQTDRDGRTTTFGYDKAGHETGETWVGGNYTATFTYDKNGQLTEAQDPNSVYTYTYDALGNLTSVDNAGTPGVPHVVLTYGYDTTGNKTSLTDSLGGGVTYGYDADQRLTSLGLSVQANSVTYEALVTLGYDNASRLTGLTRTATGGGSSDTITSSYSYDNANRLTNVTHTDATKSTTLAGYTYGYDADSRVNSYQDNSGNSLTYGYDADGQLTSAAGTLASQSYSVAYNYDPNGNRTSVVTDVGGSLTTATYSTGKGNELTSDGTYNYTYDNEGNTLTQTDIATGNVTYYTWDYANRLTEVQVKDSQGNLLNDEKFTYDVIGNRIGVSVNGTQQLYTVYDGVNPYIDFNGSGQATQRYLTNLNGLNQFYGQMSAGGTPQWFLTDNINSIRQVVDTSGNMLDAISYDPYGSIVSQTNSANAVRFGFTGASVDSLTKNDLLWARPYSPLDGRFGSQDPLEFAAGDTDLYRYVFNAPISATDPGGFDKEKKKYKLPIGYFPPYPAAQPAPGLEVHITSLKIGVYDFHIHGSAEPNLFGTFDPTIKMKCPNIIKGFDFNVEVKPLDIFNRPYWPGTVFQLEIPF